MRRQALQGALTAKFGDGAIKVVDGSRSTTSRPVSWPATSPAGGRGQGAVVAPDGDEKLERSARNLPKVSILRADSLNVVDVLDADTLLILQPSLERMAGGVRMTSSQPDRAPARHQREVDGPDPPQQVHLPRQATTPTSSRSRQAVEELFKVEVSTSTC
jgi:hypothetical protein